MSRLPLAVLLAALCVAGAQKAWSNPFISTPTQQRAPAIPGVRWGPLVRALRDLNERLAALVQEARSAHAAGPRVLLLGVAFAYGLLHALGPGHRKTALVSYFLSESARIGTGIVAGVLMSALHAASAVALVLGATFLLTGSVSQILTSTSYRLECASYASIAAIGLVMLAGKVISLVRSRAQTKRERPALADGQRTDRARGLPLLIIVSGVVPCPGAAMLLVLGISLDALRLGILAVAAMSAGMATALLAISVAAILLRERALRLTRGGGRVAQVVHHGLEIGGAAALTGFGLIMLLTRI